MQRELSSLGPMMLELISREHSLLRELLDMMDVEQAALVAGGPVEHLLEDKQKHLNKLEEATRDRLRVLEQNNYPADRDGMLDCINSLALHAGLAAEYEAFVSTAAACRTRNNSLAQVARRREGFMTRVQATLQAKDSTELPAYSASGDYLAGNTSRLLGCA